MSRHDEICGPFPHGGRGGRRRVPLNGVDTRLFTRISNNGGCRMANQLDFTVGGLLDHIAGRFPDNDALVYVERDLRYTYREFNEICRLVAKGLLRLGIRKGDHISIWAYNVPEWAILQFATAKIGAVLVTVNTSY